MSENVTPQKKVDPQMWIHQLNASTKTEVALTINIITTITIIITIQLSLQIPTPY